MTKQFNDLTEFIQNGGTAKEYLQMGNSKEFTLDETELPNQAEDTKEENSEKSIGNYEYNLTDAGNGEQFANEYKETVRFNHNRGKWLIWNDQFWEVDISQEVTSCAISIARNWKKLASDLHGHPHADDMFKFGYKSESKNRLDSMLSIAKSLKPIGTIGTDWNSNIKLIQFSNGVYNFKTKEFRSGKPKDLISKSTGYDYYPDAKCPTFDKFLEDIFLGNIELIEFLQRIVGYSISANMSEQVFFLLQGNGCNGKSTLLEILKAILGDYAINSSFQTFEKSNDTSTNDLARLNNARLVTSSESGESKQLNEARLKALTGGDQVTARYLYQEPFTFKPICKIWLAVNSLPKVKDFSQGFWRRIILIPFEASFSGENQDKDILKKLSNELSGIMNWAIEGYYSWCEQGLNTPQYIKELKHDFQGEVDIVYNFFQSKCFRDKNITTSARDLFIAFDKYCQNHQVVKLISKIEFGKRLSGVSDIRSHKVGGIKKYVGIGLKNEN